MHLDTQRIDDLSHGLIGTPVAIACLVLLACVLNVVARLLIDRVISRAEAGVLPDRLRSAAAAARRTQRAKTIGSLLKSVVAGALVAVFGTMVLDQVGVNVAPIIASAGVVGLALGFGAQSLVKDYLSGLFMIFEDQYGVGDRVIVGAVGNDLATGVVEAVTLRITTLRADDGTIWHVRNGEILRVANQTQGV
ncbi:mechanosensitive ion channel family protein [Nocardioides sp. Kera G14]|uniref:mechanosensitive ion channel family protein n=1 Tax=Nocardioides sp. Kera G14 TaxID=2884264 RepID=UPI001D0F98ED|nr:mechanosensitive ion channel domain-containing protein [Nocardioides sp. Kera G14]UDY24470.1 mechanosensitive ion channel family protein [Nocardioides sp. Kera G14]